MSRPNVLFIFSDEHAFDHLGAYGHPLAKTPNLDRLVERGVSFTDAYTPSPICVPARAALATGRWCHQTRHWDNALSYRGTPDSWAHRVRAGGGTATSIGKLHYRSSADDNGWSEELLPAHIVDGIGQVLGAVRDPLPRQLDPRPNLHKPYGAGLSSYNKYDLSVAATAADWIRRHAADEEPWALQVGLVAPHFPLVVPQEYLDLYPIDDIPSPRLPPASHPRHPWVERRVEHHGQDPLFHDDLDRRGAIQAYLGLCSFLDDRVGEVLRALDESGAADRTIVIYSSDHGEFAGSRGLWGKSAMYNEAARVPMIVAGPGIEGATVNRTPVNLVDIHPTICEVVGADPADDIVGTSLLGLIGSDDPGRLQFSEYHAIGSPTAGFLVRKGSSVLHHYVDHEPELFDLATDPGQVHDLAALPEHADTLADLERELAGFGDPATIDRMAKDDQAELVERFGGPVAALSVGPKGATPVGTSDAED